MARGPTSGSRSLFSRSARGGRLGQTVWSARRLARKLARVAVGIGPAVEPQLREAPVMSEGCWVGLDVHARSVVPGVIDRGSGEVRSLRVPPGNEGTVAWAEDAACAGPGRVRAGSTTPARTRASATSHRPSTSNYTLSEGQVRSLERPCDPTNRVPVEPGPAHSVSGAVPLVRVGG